VSALGHYLEEEGIATVAISLIRPQTEKTRPPRTLWVPFQLGRPFGPPGEPAFQRRVVVAALQLLERSTGPVIIEDFPDDDPREKPDPSWRPPTLPAVSADETPAAIASRLSAEILVLGDLHHRWIAEHGRTAVGLSGLSMQELCSYIGEWLHGREPSSPNAAFSPLLLLRFAADDLKAYCLEAGAAEPGKPSSRQLYDWFWRATAAGAALIALREALLAGGNDRARLIAGNFLVPAPYLPDTARPATIPATSMGPWQPGQ
jgi:hypothetical protein